MTTIEEVSVRTFIKSRINELFDDGEPIPHTDQIVSQVISEIDDDPNLRSQALLELLPVAISTILHEVVHERRSVMAIGTEGNGGRRISRRIESVDGKYQRLLDLRREDLLSVAEDREKRADAEKKQADFLRELAKGMRGEQTVKERYTIAQITRIERRYSNLNL